MKALSLIELIIVVIIIGILVALAFWGVQGFLDRARTNAAEAQGVEVAKAYQVKSAEAGVAVTKAGATNTAPNVGTVVPAGDFATDFPGITPATSAVNVTSFTYEGRCVTITWSASAGAHNTTAVANGACA